MFNKSLITSKSHVFLVKISKITVNQKVLLSAVHEDWLNFSVPKSLRVKRD